MCIPRPKEEEQDDNPLLWHLIRADCGCMGVRLSVDSSNHATPSKRHSHIHTNRYDVGSRERDEPPEIFDCDVSGPGSYDFVFQTKVGNVQYLSAAH